MSPATEEPSPRAFLIADDKSFLRNMIQNMLLRHHVRNVMHASNGAEAMTVLARHPNKVDCVLCDWNMEPVDGLDLLRSIRAGRVLHTSRALRVIMLTGHADESVVTTALEMDINGYVVKPVSIARLIGAIDRAFSRETTLKPPAAYMSADILSRQVGPAAHQRSPAWALLHDEGQRERDVFVQGIEAIRREAPAPVEPGGDELPGMAPIEFRKIGSIEPGRLLAEDIYTGEGKLLLASGTPLTSSLLTRLRALTVGSNENDYLLVGRMAT